MLRKSRIARWMVIPGALVLAAGIAAPTADAGTVPKKKVQANNFYFCRISKDACTSSDTNHRTRIAKGTRVIWIYKDTACDMYYPTCPGHDVKLGSHPVSATVHTQDTKIFAFTFNTVGTFHYKCTHHANQGMTGTVVVYKPSS